ncbi:MAG TPA: pitrilysin family protein [Clostridia bacterium]|nr:pitrilysin family protein [Clostridia bacterium]
MENLFEFENGLKLAYVENKAVRSIALGVYVGVGSINENAGNNGVSHFIEHMTFKGTKSRTAFDIVNEIDSIGAKINAFTSKNNTCYYTVSLDKNIEKCAEILSDLYFNSTFPEDELERERRVILEEISESEDTPDDVCMERLSETFFKGHALSRSILGTKKSLLSLSREDLFSYKAKSYTADNTVVVLTGNITFDNAKAIAEKYFVKKFDGAKCGLIEIPPAKYHSNLTKKTKKIEQSHIAFAFPSVKYEDDRDLAVQLLCTVFGLEMSSRLFQKVREQLGLCYTIYAYPSFYKKEGSLIIYTSTNPASIEKAVKAIKSEIELLLENGITDDELKKGKEQMKTGLVLGQESTTAIMRAYGRNVLFAGKLYDIDEKIAKIDKLNAEDILSVAREIFDFSKVSSSYVGTKSDIDILKLMKE